MLLSFRSTVFLTLLVVADAHYKYIKRLKETDEQIVLERQQVFTGFIALHKTESIMTEICDWGLKMLEDGTDTPTIAARPYFERLMKDNVESMTINNISIMRHPWDPRWIVSRGTYHYAYQNGTLSSDRMFIHYWTVDSPHYRLYYWQTWQR